MPDTPAGWFPALARFCGHATKSVSEWAQHLRISQRNREPMEVNLLFMDECIDESKSVLTGVLVRIEDSSAIRMDLYAMLKDRVKPHPGMVNLAPPELHGSKMLTPAQELRKR